MEARKEANASLVLREPSEQPGLPRRCSWGVLNQGEAQRVGRGARKELC